MGASINGDVPDETKPKIAMPRRKSAVDALHERGEASTQMRDEMRAEQGPSPGHTITYPQKSGSDGRMTCPGGPRS